MKRYYGASVRLHRASTGSWKDELISLPRSVTQCRTVERCVMKIAAKRFPDWTVTSVEPLYGSEVKTHREVLATQDGWDEQEA